MPAVVRRRRRDAKWRAPPPRPDPVPPGSIAANMPLEIGVESVYILKHPDEARTYVGKTPDPARRLRQHRGEIAGGAKYTTRSVLDPSKWFIAMVVQGFGTAREALRFEWSVKHHSSSRVVRRCPSDVAWQWLQRLDSAFPSEEEAAALGMTRRVRSIAAVLHRDAEGRWDNRALRVIWRPTLPL